MTVDYFSNYIEMEKLRSQMPPAVINALKTIFACCGIPDTVVSDNGPAYASEEFNKFAAMWESDHVTTSLHYSQSNGKAESAVETCNTLLKKAKLAKADINLTLLNHHNTPREQTNFSPAQCLYGRHTQTLLPSSTMLLKPEIPQQDSKHVNRNKLITMIRQPSHCPLWTVKIQIHLWCMYSVPPIEQYRNSYAVATAPFDPSLPVHVRLPGSITWSLGVCKNHVAPRSYLVECNGTAYQCNCHHIKKANTTPKCCYSNNDGEKRERSRKLVAQTDKMLTTPQLSCYQVLYKTLSMPQQSRHLVLATRTLLHHLVKSSSRQGARSKPDLWNWTLSYNRKVFHCCYVIYNNYCI